MKGKNKNLLTYLVDYLLWIIGEVFPCFRGDQRIIHEIELSLRPYYIIKTNKHEMIQTLKRRNLSSWAIGDTHKGQGNSDATGFTWIK